MLKNGVLLFVLCLLFFGAGTATAEGAVASTRIAVVNVSVLLDEAPQAAAASEQLKAQYSPRELQLDAEQKRIQQLQDMLQRESTSSAISADEKLQRERSLRKAQRVFSRKLEDFREELRTARDRAFEGVQTQIFQAIGHVREQQQIDVVLKESQFVAASDSIDITEQVLIHLRQQFATATGNTNTLPASPGILPTDADAADQETAVETDQ